MTTALWGAASTAPMHIVHLGYALGTIVGPLLVIPFIPSNATHSANHSDDNYDVTLTYGRYFTRTFSNHDENNSTYLGNDISNRMVFQHQIYILFRREKK